MQEPSAINRLHFGQIACLGDTECLSADLGSHVYPPHFHETFMIACIHGGTEAMAYRGQTIHAPQGSIVMLNPGEVHTGYIAGNERWSYQALYPSVETLTHFFEHAHEQILGTCFFNQVLLQQPELMNKLRLALGACGPDSSQLKQSSLWLDALTDLIRSCVRPLPERHQVHDSRAVSKAKSFIREHALCDISLDDLANHVHVSKYHLLRHFKSVVGMPPHAYQTVLRVEWAKRHLSAGQSAAEVALQSGFFDASHFHKTFKRLVGIPPAAYRHLLLSD